MLARILFAVALVAAFISGGESQQVACGGAGFDLSSITGVDMTYSQGGYLWRLRPCGIVNGTGAGACVGQLCQNTTRVSVYNPYASWFRVRPELNGGNGVEQEGDTGDQNGCTQPRGAKIQFLCNTAATTPYISSITEQNTCIYTAVVQTSAACNSVPEVFAPGLSRNSPICGGGFYNIDALNQQDIEVLTPGATNYSIRVCGNTTNPRCAAHQPTSVCQINANDQFNLANYNGNTEIIYTLTTTGMWMFIQDGDFCGGTTPRSTNVTFVCSPSATTPVLAFTGEGPTCAYNFRITTNAVCVNLASSSGGGAVVVSGSSSSTGVARLLGSSSSSTGGVVPSVASSSSTGSPVVIVPSSSSTGSSSTPPPAGNGAASFAPSIVAMIVAIIVAIIA